MKNTTDSLLHRWSGPGKKTLLSLLPVLYLYHGHSVLRSLTQSQGELVEALQLGHQGANGVPGLLLQSEVARVLDRLQAEKHRCSHTKKNNWTILLLI